MDDDFLRIILKANVKKKCLYVYCTVLKERFEKPIHYTFVLFSLMISFVDQDMK